MATDSQCPHSVRSLSRWKQGRLPATPPSRPPWKKRAMPATPPLRPARRINAHVTFIPTSLAPWIARPRGGGRMFFPRSSLRPRPLHLPLLGPLLAKSLGFPPKRRRHQHFFGRQRSSPHPGTPVCHFRLHPGFPNFQSICAHSLHLGFQEPYFLGALQTRIETLSRQPMRFV